MEFDWTCEQDGANGNFKNLCLAEGIMMMP